MGFETFGSVNSAISWQASVPSLLEVNQLFLLIEPSDDVSPSSCNFRIRLSPLTAKWRPCMTCRRWLSFSVWCFNELLNDFLVLVIKLHYKHTHTHTLLVSLMASNIFVAAFDFDFPEGPSSLSGSLLIFHPNLISLHQPFDKISIPKNDSVELKRMELKCQFVGFQNRACVLIHEL